MPNTKEKGASKVLCFMSLSLFVSHIFNLSRKSALCTVSLGSDFAFSEPSRYKMSRTFTMSEVAAE